MAAPVPEAIAGAAPVETQALARKAQAQAREQAERQRALAAPMAARRAAAPPEAATADADTGALHWLDSIRQLLREGDEAGARASLARFLQAHPQHPLPEDLQHLREPAPP